MFFRKQALSAAFAVAFLGAVGSAMGQEGETIVIEVFVDEDGNTEIVCPTTQCNASCRDLEGTQILLQDTFYRIGSNCSITITDGALLQEAIETVFAFLADVIPEAPAPAGGDIIGVQEELQNTESNPNQNTVPSASAVAP
jgi:hypothetical protein